MKNQENEIEKAITKTIADYKSKIEFYKGGIKKLCDTLSFFKKGEPNKTEIKHGGVRPNAGRKKLKEKEIKAIVSTVPKKRGKYKKSKKLKVKYRNGLKPVQWDKLLLPLLAKANKPMNVSDIVNELFKFKKNKNKQVLKDRLYSALCVFRNKGSVESVMVNNTTHYKLAKVEAN